jgi:hypothetical protein
MDSHWSLKSPRNPSDATCVWYEKMKKKPKLTRKQRKKLAQKRRDNPPPRRYVTRVKERAVFPDSPNPYDEGWQVYLVEGFTAIPAPLMARQPEKADKDGRTLAAKTGCEYLPDEGLPDKVKKQPLKQLTPQEINEFYAYDGRVPKS